MPEALTWSAKKGPELVVPDRSSYVVPNGRLGGSSGGVNIKVVNMPGISSSQTSSMRDGKQMVEIVNRVVETRFGGLLNQHAPLIGARPVAKRTV